MNVLGSGAEARIFLDANGDVVKDRICKNYRIGDIDKKLRAFRTRREAKILEKLDKAGILAPKLKSVDDVGMKIVMSFVDGKKLRDVLQDDINNAKNFSREVGRKIGVLHSNHIIHSDLTTSNMILDGEIKFIDFGLSFFSSKIEDKAVDLHLFRQALESKHYEIWEKCFDCAIKGYKETCIDAEQILQRLAVVEKRGRNKNK